MSPSRRSTRPARGGGASTAISTSARWRTTAAMCANLVARGGRDALGNGPQTLDLYGPRLSFVWASYLPRGSAGVPADADYFDDDLRMDIIGESHRRVDVAKGDGSRTTVDFVSVTGSRGNVHYVQECTGDCPAGAIAARSATTARRAGEPSPCCPQPRRASTRAARRQDVGPRWSPISRRFLASSIPGHDRRSRRHAAPDRSH